MPVKITKVKGGYSVSHGSKVSAKRTTKKKAEAQKRLLEMEAANKKKGK